MKGDLGMSKPEPPTEAVIWSRHTAIAGTAGAAICSALSTRSATLSASLLLVSIHVIMEYLGWRSVPQASSWRLVEVVRKVAECVLSKRCL